MLPAIFIACNKDDGKKEEEPTFILNREEIIGCWEIAMAKFDESATMTEWEYEDTYATFKENGIYEGEGYFGKGTGTYSVEGNVITTKIENIPFIEYEVTSMEGGAAHLTATISATGQKIWMICGKAEFLDQKPEDHFSEDVVFRSEQEVQRYFNSLYSNISEFVILQNRIEQKIISNPQKVFTPQDSDIKSLWQKGYAILRMANLGYKQIGDTKAEELPGRYDYMSHIRVIRGFVSYIMTMLWGDIPYTKESDTDATLPVKTQSYILNEALVDVSVKSGYEFGGYPQDIFFNTNISVILKAECNLSLKNSQKALEQLQYNKDIDEKAEIYLQLLNPQQEYFTVYNKVYYELLLQESKGEIDGLPSRWKNECPQYGYWLMLKRIGKAEEVLGCQSFQLLLPIPATEIGQNPNVTQNPGY